MAALLRSARSLRRAAVALHRLPVIAVVRLNSNVAGSYQMTIALPHGLTTTTKT